jgi:hypothetical protein
MSPLHIDKKYIPMSKDENLIKIQSHVRGFLAR